VYADLVKLLSRARMLPNAAASSTSRFRALPTARSPICIIAVTLGSSEARRIGLLSPSWMPLTSSRQSR
jgi:hypothetical protein